MVPAMVSIIRGGRICNGMHVSVGGPAWLPAALSRDDLLRATARVLCGPAWRRRQDPCAYQVSPQQ